MGRKGAQSRLFVFLHEAAKAVYVGAQDGCELALHTRPLWRFIIYPALKSVKDELSHFEGNGSGWQAPTLADEGAQGALEGARIAAGVNLNRMKVNARGLLRLQPIDRTTEIADIAGFIEQTRRDRRRRRHRTALAPRFLDGVD